MFTYGIGGVGRVPGFPTNGTSHRAATSHPPAIRKLGKVLEAWISRARICLTGLATNETNATAGTAKGAQADLQCINTVATGPAPPCRFGSCWAR